MKKQAKLDIKTHKQAPAYSLTLMVEGEDIPEALQELQAHPELLTRLVKGLLDEVV